MILQIIGFFRIKFYYLKMYILNKLKLFNVDEIYIDQSGKKTFFGDRCISSCYTPYGIKQLDTEFIKRIQNMHQTKENPKTIEKDIKSNKHLHNEIKSSLLFNLKNYTSNNK